MLIYTSKQAAFGIAAARGSSATTWNGIMRYLRSHKGVDARPLEARGERWGSLRRITRQAWAETRMEAIARRRLESLGLLDREEADARRAKVISKSIESHAEYRRSQSGWAGGDHSVSVQIVRSGPSCFGGSTTVWSDNRKWSGRDSHNGFHITERTVQALGENGLVIGGLVTLDAEPVAPREYRAAWAEQSRGFDLKMAEGWIIRGHHIRGGTLKAARAKATKARAEAARALMAKRTSTRNLAKVWVGLDDSLRGGNCPAGTDAFASSLRQEFGQIGGIRADVLLARRDDTYTRRAVGAALVRGQAI